jgi:hypothetical protein
VGVAVQVGDGIVIMELDRVEAELLVDGQLVVEVNGLADVRAEGIAASLMFQGPNENR